MNNLINIHPKIAILDDDIEFADDIKNCLDEDFFCQVFLNEKSLYEGVSQSYNNFLNNLNDFFKLLKTKDMTIDTVKSGVIKLIKDRPFSTALIDLNLNNSNPNQGLQICEDLLNYNLFPIAYTGHDFNDFFLDMINQGLIYGYMSKSSDFFESLVPCILSSNQRFYNFHYNLTHHLIFSQKNKIVTENFINDLEKEYIVFNNELIYI